MSKPFVPLYNKELFMATFGNPDNIEILEVFLEDLFDLRTGSLHGKVTIENTHIPAAKKDYLLVNAKVNGQVKKVMITIRDHELCVVTITLNKRK